MAKEAQARKITMLTFSEKCVWARKAVILDTEKNEDYQKFRKISKESGLGERQLSYYSNAYEAADESGIKALSCRGNRGQRPIFC
jgi:hypothetical protein